MIFNFVAANTIEGKLVGRLLQKLEAMRADLGERVYDVVGEVLARSGLDFERLLRESLLHPERVDEGEREIQRISADALEAYERDIGIAQATKHVDMSWVRQRDWRSEERRLMPEFVEQFFRRACRQLNVRLEDRADGLLRIEHVPRVLTSDRLRAVQRLGKPQASYRKLTFHKEQRQRAEHEDAVLLSPGHPLYAATVEALVAKLAAIEQAAAPFVAPWTVDPYPIHFFTHRVQGLDAHGQPEDVFAELIAVTEDDDGHALVGADVLHDLTPVDFEPIGIAPPSPEEIRAATNFVRVQVQQDVVRDKRAERLSQAELRSSYLQEAMDAQLEVLQAKWSELDDRVYRGDDAARLARDEADRRIQDTRQRRERKLAELEQLGIVRPGPVLYLGTALVGPWPTADEPAVQAMRNDPEVEAAAMAWAMQIERDAGWDPEDVSNERDGRGFDIRSVKRGPHGEVLDVRRIEVKGRAPDHGDVSLCRTEWIAAHRHGPTFWLYVLYGATGDTPRGVRIQDPARVLGDRVQEVTKVTTYLVPGRAIDEVSP